MDKDQAIQIIREEYELGYSPTDIAQNLSQELGAPFELVYPFVMQTLAAEVESTAEIEPVEEIAPVEEPIPPPSPPAEPEAPPIPGYEAFPEEGPFEAAEEPGEPEAPPTETAQPPAFVEAAAPDLKTLEQNPKVEKFVLQMLSSNKKNSDVVLAVCERTGLGWEEAQRLVARISAKNRKMLQSRRNRLPLMLSILALSAGGLMVFAGISEGYTIYTALRAAQSSQEMVMVAASQQFLRDALWALIVGGTLMLGGTVGLFIALRNQFE